MPGTDKAHYVTPLRASYPMSGTDIPYQAIECLGAPVAMVVDQVSYAICLRACYAVSAMLSPRTSYAMSGPELATTCLHQEHNKLYVASYHHNSISVFESDGRLCYLPTLKLRLVWY
eukprot:3880515-Rhodomonas_salina.2